MSYSSDLEAKRSLEYEVDHAELCVSSESARSGVGASTRILESSSDLDTSGSVSLTTWNVGLD